MTAEIYFNIHTLHTPVKQTSVFSKAFFAYIDLFYLREGVTNLKWNYSLVYFLVFCATADDLAVLSEDVILT